MAKSRPGYLKRLRKKASKTMQDGLTFKVRSGIFACAQHRLNISAQEFGENKWKKRWIHISGQIMTIHKTAKTPRKGASKAHQSISLATAQVTVNGTKEVKIFHLDGRHIMNLSLDADEELEKWLHALRDDGTSSRARLRVTQMFASQSPIEAMTLVPSARELVCLTMKNEVTVRLVEDGDVVRSTSLDDGGGQSKKRTIATAGSLIWVGIGSKLIHLDIETLKAIRRVENRPSGILGTKQV
jgi:hypothetical protein